MERKTKRINSRAGDQEIMRADKALWARSDESRGQMNHHAKVHSWKPTFKSPQPMLIVEKKNIVVFFSLFISIL